MPDSAVNVRCSLKGSCDGMRTNLDRVSVQHLTPSWSVSRLHQYDGKGNASIEKAGCRIRKVNKIRRRLVDGAGPDRLNIPQAPEPAI